MCSECKKLSEKQYIGIFVFSFILLILGRMIAQWISPCFDSLNYGQMTPFFMEVLTCLIWAAAMIAIAFVFWKKYGVTLLSNPLTRGQELENRNLAIVILIIMASIFIISAQIGYQVKPFYDMGVKFTGYQLMENVGGILRNIIKCIWIVFLMSCAQNVGESFAEKKWNSEKGKMLKYIPWGGIAVMLTIGVYDWVCGMTTLKVTYFCMNLVFGMIYLLTHKSISKTYICVLLIYIL